MPVCVHFSAMKQVFKNVLFKLQKKNSIGYSLQKFDFSTNF